MVRFIHITDTHLGPNPHFSLYGRQPLEYLQRVINRINDLPFEVDFVLHTGDCVDDGREDSYLLFQEAMSHLRFPVRYVAGNHDDANRLQSIVIKQEARPRLDYTFDVAGIRFVVLDTRGPVDPGGNVQAGQLEWLSSLCGKDGPPMVVAMHHCPVTLDTPWLDAPPPGWGGRFMFIDNAAEVLRVLKPATARIRGVFTGHVHGLYLTNRDGVLYCCGQSTFAPLPALPVSDRVANEESQTPMFNLVTVTDDQLIVRPRCFGLAR